MSQARYKKELHTYLIYSIILYNLKQLFNYIDQLSNASLFQLEYLLLSIIVSKSALLIIFLFSSAYIYILIKLRSQLSKSLLAQAFVLIIRESLIILRTSIRIVQKLLKLLVKLLLRLLNIIIQNRCRELGINRLIIRRRLYLLLIDILFKELIYQTIALLRV